MDFMWWRKLFGKRASEPPPEETKIDPMLEACSRAKSDREARLMEQALAKIESELEETFASKVEYNFHYEADTFGDDCAETLANYFRNKGFVCYRYRHFTSKTGHVLISVPNRKRG